ncbi:cell surface antigen-like protein Sca7 [Rickettsia canadensis str. CA410]|uniref:Cell surface antigen-like protein Sca7 n=1 Tax=Rickettsia canadensis str. CA410 TaxID=1105107 RepID=A0ABM5MUJ0_RICCA|nr:cell surface antigen-like protein Sca7 [Rickettsia canadensis str. CA410]
MLIAQMVVFNDQHADGGILVINAPSVINAIVNPNNGMIILILQLVLQLLEI